MKTSLTLPELKKLSVEELLDTYEYAIVKYNSVDIRNEISNLRWEIEERLLMAVRYRDMYRNLAINRSIRDNHEALKKLDD